MPYLRIMPNGDIKYPYTIAELKKDEGISIPAIGIHSDTFPAYGIHPVYPLNSPAEKVSPLYTVKRHPPALAEDGKYYEEFYIEEANIPDLLDSEGLVVETSTERKLRLAKTFQSNKVIAAFQIDSVAPVTYNGIQWHGGEASARNINDKANMLDYAEVTSGQIFDASGTGNTTDTYHTLTIAEMRAVAFAIAEDYETKLYNYKQALIQIEAAATITAVEAIDYGV